MTIPTRNDWNYGDALGNMTSHWVDPETGELRPNATAFLMAVMIEVQDLEDALYSLTFDRLLETAFGAGLDQIGELVGQERPGADDDEYRRYINARISINRSGGEIDRIIWVTGTITGADLVKLDQIFPAGVQIDYWVPSSLTDAQRSRIAQMILETTAAGVGLDIVEAITQQAFAFLGAPDALGFDEGLFGEVVASYG